MNELIGLLAPLAKDWKPAEFAQNLALVLIAWSVVKNSVNKHFEGIKVEVTSIKDELKNMSSSISGLAKTLSSVEASHGERITKVEMDVKKLSTRVIREEH